MFWEKAKSNRCRRRKIYFLLVCGVYSSLAVCFIVDSIHCRTRPLGRASWVFLIGGVSVFRDCSVWFSPLTLAFHADIEVVGEEWVIRRSIGSRSFNHSAPEVTENSSSQQEQSNPPLVDQVFLCSKPIWHPNSTKKASRSRESRKSLRKPLSLNLRVIGNTDCHNRSCMKDVIWSFWNIET